MIHVILVEDHALVMEGVRATLDREQDITCLASYPTAAALKDALKQQLPDIILMDINLPDANGIELCREVKHLYPAVKVIALSINNHPAVIRNMMDSGADGYVLKDASKQELLTAIRTVMQHKKFLSHSAAIVIRTATENDSVPPLTRREREVLELIADGLTNREIAERLSLDVTTVDSHRKNMLSKYGVKNTSALVKLAMQHNLIK